MIIAHAVKDIEVMIQELDKASRKCELKMNMRQIEITAGTTITNKAVYISGI